MFILNCKMQSNHFSTYLQSFLVKLGNSIGLWGYWWKLGVVLAQLHWTLSKCPSWKEIHFASHTLLFHQPPGIWYSRWALSIPGTVAQVQLVLYPLLHEFTCALLVREHLCTLKICIEHQICGGLWCFESWIHTEILTSIIFTPR